MLTDVVIFLFCRLFSREVSVSGGSGRSGGGKRNCGGVRGDGGERSVRRVGCESGGGGSG